LLLSAFIFIRANELHVLRVATLHAYNHINCQSKLCQPHALQTALFFN